MMQSLTNRLVLQLIAVLSKREVFVDRNQQLMDILHKSWSECEESKVPREQRPLCIQDEPTIENLDALDRRILRQYNLG